MKTHLIRIVQRLWIDLQLRGAARYSLQNTGNLPQGCSLNCYAIYARRDDEIAEEPRLQKLYEDRLLAQDWFIDY